jgi:alanine racemase
MNNNITNRRDFLKITGTGSLAVILSGASTLKSCKSIKHENNFNIEEQIDPWIELNLDNLAANVKEVRNRIGDRHIMAVLKCNAYGHGAIAIATALQSNSNIKHFAVVKVREALDLRKNNINGMILNMGPFNRPDSIELINNNISQAVYSEAVNVLSEEAKKLGKKANVQIYIDTGMSRVGVPYREAISFIEKVAGNPEININGIFTALTEDDEMNPIQIKRIENICEEAKKRGIDLGISHAAASAEVDRYPYSWLDMVRPGSCLLGLEPEEQNNIQIKPVMSFKTRVVFVKKLLPGESISYHQAYKINKETLIATLPCGYSDGYPAVVSNKSDILIRGRRHPVVAPITANHIMVDITGSEDIKIGDEAVLWGNQGNEKVTKVELEQLAPNSTNTYRIATRIPSYTPRIII